MNGKLSAEGKARPSGFQAGIRETAVFSGEITPIDKN
jgi:hypothetical protein